MPDELHKTNKSFSSDLATLMPSDVGSCLGNRHHTKRTPAPTTEGGFPKGLKRQCSPATRAPGSQPHTISRLSKLLATCTDEQYKEIIKHLPEGWSTMNDKGSNVTKRQLEMAQWGAYKDDHNVLTFQQIIMSTRQHANTVTQYDTLVAQSIVDQNEVWTR